MKDALSVGIIGLGLRGTSLLKNVILKQPDVSVRAICDISRDNCNRVAEYMKENGLEKPEIYTDYKQLLASKRIDTVIISTSWESHIDIACDAMRAGKAVGYEVGGAYSLEQLWELVNVYEETKVPCAMLENTCYGRDELLVLNMVRQGLFGEVVHCAGGYRHDLRKEILSEGHAWEFRLQNLQNRCCDYYPTHDLGPIANVLNINHGNRMLSLVSQASKAVGLKDYAARNETEKVETKCKDIKQGDIVVTIITCAHGEIITLTLDTTLPRAYSRDFQVSGTRAVYNEINRSIFLDGKDSHDVDWKTRWGCVEEYREEYDDPMWKAYLNGGEKKGDHDGIDWFVLRSFFDGVKEGESKPADVYDAASWMAVSVLTEQSIAMGGLPVPFPDFTAGKWITRKPWEP